MDTIDDRERWAIARLRKRRDLRVPRVVTFVIMSAAA
jgi:hypothetical protein